MYVQDILIESQQANELCHLNPNYQYDTEQIALVFDTLGYTQSVVRPDNLYPAMFADGIIPMFNRLPAIHPINNPSGFLNLPGHIFNVIVEDWLLGNQYHAQVSQSPTNGVHLMIPGAIAGQDAQLNIGLSPDLQVEFMTLYCPNGYFSIFQLSEGLAQFRGLLLEVLPVVSGMVFSWNTRGRDYVWLGPKKQMQVRGIISGVSVLELNRPGTTILNPREHDTGITRSPHIRSGHWRNFADGTRTWIPAVVIHEDDFVPGVHDQRILR